MQKGPEMGFRVPGQGMFGPCGIDFGWDSVVNSKQVERGYEVEAWFLRFRAQMSCFWQRSENCRLYHIGRLLKIPS